MRNPLLSVKYLMNNVIEYFDGPDSKFIRVVPQLLKFVYLI